ASAPLSLRGRGPRGGVWSHVEYTDSGALLRTTARDPREDGGAQGGEHEEPQTAHQCGAEPVERQEPAHAHDAECVRGAQVREQLRATVEGPAAVQGQGVERDGAWREVTRGV